SVATLVALRVWLEEKVIVPQDTAAEGRGESPRAPIIEASHTSAHRGRCQRPWSAASKPNPCTDLENRRNKGPSRPATGNTAPKTAFNRAGTGLVLVNFPTIKSTRSRAGPCANKGDKERVEPCIRSHSSEAV